jgi:aspartate dehydrogenase
VLSTLRVVRPMRVGLIGCGAIGRGLLELLRPEDQVELVGALVADPSKPRPAEMPPLCATLDVLLERQPSVVIEMGGHEALGCHGPGVLRSGIDLLMVSVGALANREVEREIVAAARDGGSHAVVVSGAIGGLDALAAAAIGGLSSVTHTTRKPGRALMAPAEAAALREPVELFRGPAREGALRFPESINVAAAVSLAGIGFDRTTVCVVADPSIDRNQHEVVAEGAFGTLRFEIRNIPSAENPRTGRLVAMSVLHALRKRQAVLVIG